MLNTELHHTLDLNAMIKQAITLGQGEDSHHSRSLSDPFQAYPGSNSTPLLGTPPGA